MDPNIPTPTQTNINRFKTKMPYSKKTFLNNKDQVAALAVSLDP